MPANKLYTYMSFDSGHGKKPTDELLRLVEIKEEIKELAREAIHIVKDITIPNTTIHSRAKAYWYPRILNSLEDEEGYSSMCTMEETIQEIKEQ